MIRLSKNIEPKVLLDNSAKWTQVLLDHEDAGTAPNDAEKGRYNHADIKAALISETHGKCAYCESKFEHITYGDIEHITPKRHGARYYFQWNNLTIACDRCNTNKATNSNIVDPYESDPETLFRAAGPMLLPRPEFDNAMVTERVLKLNRSPLIERRAERIKWIHDTVLMAQRYSGNERQAIIDDLKANEMASSAEFAAVSRAYISGLEAEGVI